MRKSRRKAAAAGEGRPIVTVVDAPPPSARSLGDLLFGRRLASTEEDEERIGPVAGVPVLGLDALSSAAYGPEAALTLLLPLGVLGLVVRGPDHRDHRRASCSSSTSRTARRSPPTRTAAARTPSRRRTSGTGAALLAGAALALDYVLNVAVGISAGVGALVSAVPALLPHTLPLCLVILGAAHAGQPARHARVGHHLPAADVPVRRRRSASSSSLGASKRVALAGGHPAPGHATARAPGPAPRRSSLWLLMRAFASGCTAMTGVEAVSNGVPGLPPADDPQRASGR